jgi:lipid II:glycine glycyltransferase (peptidoglycan interpeptide bridge formation enzyme)
MHSRKNFDENVNIESFRQINNELEHDLKLQIFICSLDGKPLSAMVTSVIGKTGIYLLGGTSKKGLELSSSYLLQWEVIKWMKAHGINNYDLGGIDKEENPGVYTFKSGMGGDEISYLSGFESSVDGISKLILKVAGK